MLRAIRCISGICCISGIRCILNVHVQNNIPHSDILNKNTINSIRKILTVLLYSSKNERANTDYCKSGEPRDKTLSGYDAGVAQISAKFINGGWTRPGNGWSVQETEYKQRMGRIKEN